MAQQPWYKSWFDSPYYHILYQHRDKREARVFIQNLIQFLKPNPQAKALDLACGRGRHAIQLHELGLDVLGVDLSPSSIEFAKSFEEHGLRFKCQDMRDDLGREAFDYVFNLFTSFGYFTDSANDLAAMHAITRSLVPGGYLIIDFMNVHKVSLGLVEEDVREVDGIVFRINRWDTGDFIKKEIAFTADGDDYVFEERVKKLEKHHFEKYFHESGLRLKHVFGDFYLGPFDNDHSERLIMIAEKT